MVPFEGNALRQTTGRVAAILREAARLRAASHVGNKRVALVVARIRVPADYDVAVTAICLTLVPRPLHRLQRINRSGHPAAVPLVMERIAAELSWPTKLDRVVAAARGLYRGQAAGTPLWTGYGSSTPVDMTWSPGWLLDLTAG